MTVVTVGAYLTCVAAALVLVWAGLRHPEAIASLHELFEVVLAGRAARVVLVVFWWWLGWHFLIGPTLGP